MILSLAYINTPCYIHSFAIYLQLPLKLLSSYTHYLHFPFRPANRSSTIRFRSEMGRSILSRWIISFLLVFVLVVEVHVRKYAMASNFQDLEFLFVQECVFSIYIELISAGNNCFVTCSSASTTQHLFHGKCRNLFINLLKKFRKKGGYQ